MIHEPKYLKLQEVISRVLRHPLLQEVNLEQGIQYTIDFMHLFGLPDMYQDKEVILKVKKHRAELPCDVVTVNQVMDMRTGQCMRSMTDTFDPIQEPGDCCFPNHRGKHIIGYGGYPDESTFRIQNHIITTSMECGDIKVHYKAVPVDDEGQPLLLDDANYLKALELYIKKEVFTILFDQGKLSSAVLANTQTEYAWAAKRLQGEFATPSESEMESLSRMWTQLIPTVTEFDKGFRFLGDREYLRRH